MAIGINILISAAQNSTGSASSVTTASITPTGNALVIASVYSAHSNANPNAPTITGCSLTWVQIATLLYDTTSGSRRRITVFRAMGASPSSGTLTIDFGGQAQAGDIGWSVEEFTGVSTGGTNGSDAIVQSVSSTPDAASATSGSVTLAAFGNVANATYGVISHGSDEVTTPGSGFTEIGEVHAFTGGYGNSLQTEYLLGNDTTVDGSWATSTNWGVIGIEIAVATTATAVKRLSLLGVGF